MQGTWTRICAYADANVGTTHAVYHSPNVFSFERRLTMRARSERLIPLDYSRLATRHPTPSSFSLYTQSHNAIRIRRATTKHSHPVRRPSAAISASTRINVSDNTQCVRSRTLKPPPPPQLDNGNTHMHANPSVLCSDGKSGKATLRFLHLNTCHAKQFCKIPARQIRNPLPAHLFVHETKRNETKRNEVLRVAPSSENTSGKPGISYLASRISPWFIKSCHTQPNLAACMYRAKLASSFWPAPVSRRACWYRVFKVPSGSSESSSSSGAL
jgi:hypothetical protein